MGQSLVVRGCVVGFILMLLLAGVAAHDDRRPGHQRPSGRQLYEDETFAGNGRTCVTCHTRETGTLSPEQARRRFKKDRRDPLFLHDGSDDGQGNGATRMLREATVLVEIPLPPNVRLRDEPDARTVTLRRGIPSTLNTPALDPVLMLDGREPDLETQALGAIRGHAQSNVVVPTPQLEAIALFQQTSGFFSSDVLKRFAHGGKAPVLPRGWSASERRGRRFFEDLPPGETLKDGLCASCHSGPMLNQTNQFLPIPGVQAGTRFQTAGVSELNAAGNPVREFVFTNPDGTETVVSSPDPGRALITGVAQDPTGSHVNAFKISPLWGVKRTAPYFHDNSAKTLADVAEHYATFFSIVTDPDGPAGPAQPAVVLTPQDQADIVAYMKLLE